MKKILLICAIMFGFTVSAQVGIGTVTPNHALEIESTDSGLVIPRVANTTAVTVTPIDGTMVYDISASCIKAYEGGAWSACFSGGGAPARSVFEITTNAYNVQLNDDILVYTASGAGTLTLPTGAPLGKEYVVVNNAGDNFSLLALDTQATTGSIQLSANAATTLIHIGGDEFAALHSF